MTQEISRDEEKNVAVDGAFSPTVARRISLVDEAYTAIRSIIIDGKIPPGSRMTVRPIANQIGLSATPIKGALVKLEREGVLVAKLHRGYFVPELSAEDMREIYEMREALDRLASRLAAASVNHASIGMKLRANYEQQCAFFESNDVDGYRHSDIDFHHNLWTLSGNNRLLRTAEQLMDQMKLGNSVLARLPRRVEMSLSEHLAIVEAIEQGDSEGAEAAAYEHISSVMKSFMKRVPA